MYSFMIMNWLNLPRNDVCEVVKSPDGELGPPLPHQADRLASAVWEDRVLLLTLILQWTAAAVVHHADGEDIVIVVVVVIVVGVVVIVIIVVVLVRNGRDYGHDRLRRGQAFFKTDMRKSKKYGIHVPARKSRQKSWTPKRQTWDPRIPRTTSPESSLVAGTSG